MGNESEEQRLTENASRLANWKRWGPYLPERQWGTVREDYSADGTCWDYFSHDQARSRVYRWGEDGLLGLTDRQCRLCFAPAIWNGNDPFLKERLFGLTGPEGSHGEDVKEEYFYLRSSPTHSYCQALYKYPQRAFPYHQLVEKNQGRDKRLGEFELRDTGIFDDNQYFDLFVEYAKDGPDDLYIELTVVNRYAKKAVAHLAPALWFRNTWTWGRRHEACSQRPQMIAEDKNRVRLEHETLGRFFFDIDPELDPIYKDLLFTENESNWNRLYGSENESTYVKDAFHEYIVDQRLDAVNPEGWGTKVAPYFRVELKAGESRRFRMRLYGESTSNGSSGFAGFEDVKRERIQEMEAFYESRLPSGLPGSKRETALQAYGGLCWSKQFYHYIVEDWLDGDPEMPDPPESRRLGRNHRWRHVYSRDVLSMPDKWEYPWFAAWDLAFHMIPFARVDSQFAKEQLTLLLREWYMSPSGQIPAYEFAFGDVNPPVHAWAALRVFEIEREQTGVGDRQFLEGVFQKLLMNFTWWVNRKDENGENLFSGGFLGLDNIGIFDRSKPLPTGGELQQADGTAWMAFYCSTMLSISLELASDGDTVFPAYEDMASKFLEHFVQINDAINAVGESGLWDEDDGFYYDHINYGDSRETLRTRSMVGLLPLIAAQTLHEDRFSKLKGFKRRTDWFLKYRPDLARHISMGPDGRWLLALTSRERLIRALEYLASEDEFLSPYGLRSLSKFHKKNPFKLDVNGEIHEVSYEPGESTTWLFGGNSNWRGPVWFPVNFIIFEALGVYESYYGDRLTIQMRGADGVRRIGLRELRAEIANRLMRLFEPGSENEGPPFAGSDDRFRNNEGWRPYRWFHEYFDADTGRGLGASHQTGWTALVATLMEHQANEE